MSTALELVQDELDAAENMVRDARLDLDFASAQLDDAVSTYDIAKARRDNLRTAIENLTLANAMSA